MTSGGGSAFLTLDASELERRVPPASKGGRSSGREAVGGALCAVGDPSLGPGGPVALETRCVLREIDAKLQRRNLLALTACNWIPLSWVPVFHRMRRSTPSAFFCYVVVLLVLNTGRSAQTCSLQSARGHGESSSRCREFKRINGFYDATISIVL